MNLIIDNLYWMAFNLSLAVLGLTFGWLFYYIKKPIPAFMFFVLWVLFIPNTIYLITDLQYLPIQWPDSNLLTKALLVLEFGTLAIIGLVSFIVSMYPVDKIFSEFHLKKQENLKLSILILVNFFIAFAIVMGKFLRTHSWYIFSDPNRVIRDVLSIFNDTVLFGLVLFIGIVINLVYFGFRNVISFKLKKHFKL